MSEAFKAKADSGFDGAKRQTRHLTDAAVGNVVEIGGAQGLGLFGSKTGKRFSQVASFLLQGEDMGRVRFKALDLGHLVGLSQGAAAGDVDAPVPGDAVYPSSRVRSVRIKLASLMPNGQHDILDDIVCRSVAKPAAQHH